jgi:8-oxo-dGTP pyrophosphatase MutT (NUDIX family)
MIEETGIQPLGLEPLLTFYPSLDTIDNPTHLFVSRSHKVVSPFRPDPREVCELSWMPIAESLEMIKDGRLRDGFTIIALLSFQWCQSA